ncbi:MAG: hypothetical protein ACT4OX_10100 [Actinomycetota bacterium]
MVRTPRSGRARGLPALAVVTTLGLGLAACGGDDDDDASDPTTDTTVVTDETDGNTAEATGPNSPASELRATLTSLLQEHVYLAGIATGTALAGGELADPAAALDENSVALGDAITSVYGAEAGESFLGLWRSHIDFFVNYTTAAAAGDEAGKQAARDDLGGYAQDFAAFLAGANPSLDADTVAEALGVHAASLFDAIDAQAASDPSQYSLLRTAAQHMPATAAYLAQVIAEQMPDTFGG